jgi:hypothetical protein
MHEKIAKFYWWQGTVSQMFRDCTSANSSFSPVDFSKIGKFTSLGLKYLLEIHFYAFLQVDQQF